MTDAVDLTTGPTYVVSRSRSPIGLGAAFDPSEDVLGGQAEWFWGLPGVFHALASPKSGQPVPAAPAGAEVPHSQSLAYWAPLQYLLLYRLGWTRPHRGLMQWYDMGKPTDDPTLALVSEVWDRDGCLDVYLAWLLMRQPRVLTGKSGFELNDTEPLDNAWAQWLGATRDRLEHDPAPHFSLTGGHDNLHLMGHLGESGQLDPEATLVVRDLANRRATYLTDTMSAWYWDLRNRVRGDLPPTSRSWLIDVVVRPVGHLGIYRISRSTGLLFTGRHRYHSLGN